MSDTDTVETEQEQTEEPAKYIRKDDGTIEVIDPDAVAAFDGASLDATAYQEVLRIATEVVADKIKTSQVERRKWWVRVLDDLGIDSEENFVARTNLDGTKVILKPKPKSDW